MTCGIYKITNKLNNKSYIGQSINIQKRWSREKQSAFLKNDKCYNTILSQAFRKYGIQNFTFEILEECEPKDLNQKEQEYILLYNSYTNGYNATTGGQGPSNYCFKLSQNDIVQIYDLLLNHPEISQKTIAIQFNVIEETISEINTGKTRRLNGYVFPLRKNLMKEKNKNYCIDCGKEITSGALRCSDCNQKKSRVVERPSREELKKLIYNFPFSQIGKQFNVSDNTIRKWCINYNLPSKKKDIKQYSLEEWELV